MKRAMENVELENNETNSSVEKQLALCRSIYRVVQKKPHKL